MSCLFGALILKWWYSVRDLFIAIVMLTFLLHCTLAALPNEGDYGRRCKFLGPLLKKISLSVKIAFIETMRMPPHHNQSFVAGTQKKIFNCYLTDIRQLWPTVEEAASLAHGNDSLPLILLFDPMVTGSIVTRLG